MQASEQKASASALDELVLRKREPENAEFDITAMIDLVFMMNIYFLVTFLSVAANEIGLPSAQHVAPLDPETAVIFSVVRASDGESVVVYIGSGKEGEPLAEMRDQEQRITEAVEEGVIAGKTAVLFKGERTVSLGEMHRLALAAANEGVKLHVAVMEKDRAP